MLKWCAIYQDDPQREHCTVEQAPRATVLKRFDDARRLGMHDRRAVVGMWLIDSGTQQDDVIAIHGRGPIPISERYDTHRRSSGST